MSTSFRGFLPKISILILLPFHFQAQNEWAAGDTYGIFDEDILSVQFSLRGASLTYPIVELRSGRNALELSFDHLGADVRDYLYTIELRNADWQPTDLNDNEYINGFTEDRLTTYTNSFNTLQQYVHYSLTLPNANMRWTKSGNYLLKIYDNSAEKRLVLVRRFLVVDTQWSAIAELVKPSRVDKLNSHQEIDFTVDPKNIRVSNPLKDVKAYVLQNGRWDNAIGPLPPFSVQQNQLVYDYQDKIVFPAGKEWRYFDMRTFEYRGEYVKDVRRRPGYYEVTLKPEETRNGRSYLDNGDINGHFSIGNANVNQSLDQCDYAEVLFSIKQNQAFEDSDVYVFGELSDWQLKPEFKMHYEESVHAYVCTPYLKQGYYNYEYLVIDRKTGQPDEDGLEGNWYEAGNVYYILVYFRPFGERYDQLLVATTLDSGRH